MKEIKYYYLIMSQVEMFKKSVLEELLRERSNYYNSKSIPIDFWITIHPDFLKENSIQSLLDSSNFKKRLEKNKIDCKNEKEAYSCFITSNKEFFDWIKLRLGFFEKEQQIFPEYFYSDGIEGELEYSENLSSIKKIFLSNKYFLDKNIKINRENLINKTYQKIF
jgi:stalled ribosome alternative rescue factor ArfA